MLLKSIRLQFIQDILHTVLSKCIEDFVDKVKVGSITGYYFDDTNIVIQFTTIHRDANSPFILNSEVNTITFTAQTLLNRLVVHLLDISSEYFYSYSINLVCTFNPKDGIYSLIARIMQDAKIPYAGVDSLCLTIGNIMEQRGYKKEKMLRTEYKAIANNIHSEMNRNAIERAVRSIPSAPLSYQEFVELFRLNEVSGIQTLRSYFYKLITKSRVVMDCPTDVFYPTSYSSDGSDLYFYTSYLDVGDYSLEVIALLRNIVAEIATNDSFLSFIFANKILYGGKFLEEFIEPFMALLGIFIEDSKVK